jgi:predicted nucleic acid-binding protein
VIVYVESNFVLELARQQEEAAEADEILRLAETGRLTLVFPGIATSEPLSTLQYYGLERKKLVELMQREFRELGRLQPHKSLVTLLQPLGQTLLSVERGEMDVLESTIERLLNAGTSVPMTSGVFGEARTFSKTLGISLQDAIVYASVLQDLRARDPAVEKCFISRNPKDFDDPSVTGELKKHGCRYIARFRDGLSFIKSRSA